MQDSTYTLILQNDDMALGVDIKKDKWKVHLAHRHWKYNRHNCGACRTHVDAIMYPILHLKPAEFSWGSLSRWGVRSDLGNLIYSIYWFPIITFQTPSFLLSRDGLRVARVYYSKKKPEPIAVCSRCGRECGSISMLLIEKTLCPPPEV